LFHGVERGYRQVVQNQLESWPVNFADGLFDIRGLAEFRELLLIDNNLPGLADLANSKRKPGFEMVSG
jgi:hypothetical protein